MSSTRLRARETRGEDEGEGECERGRGGCVASPGHPDEEGRGQAGRKAGGVARRPCARVGHTPGRLAPGGRRRWWAGLACWARGAR